MVLPAHVLEQKDAEERTERTKDEEADEEKVKEGAEKALTSEGLQQAPLVMPTSTDTGKILSGPFLYKRFLMHEHFFFFFGIADGPNASVEESDIQGPPVKRVSSNPPEDHGGDQPAQEQPCDATEDGGADPAAVAAISLSKTPIMRMKTKSEPKRIAVSLKSADEAVEGIGVGGDGEPGTELEPIEAPLGQMTPMEMLLQDSMKLGGGMLVNMGLEHQKKSPAFNPTVLPAGLAQVRNHFGFFFVFYKSVFYQTG